jgi:cytochrome c oxidase assembly protein subunit 15
VSPATYRRVTVVAFLLLCVIVVTGAAVRLTNSGLGCVDWPNCNSEQFIDVSSTHAAVEQINRLFTGLVALGVIAAVLGSIVRRPRRRDLTWWSLGLVAGVIGQVVLGAIVVLVDLHPAAVQGHFVLSMALVANALVLIRRAGQPDGVPVRRVVSDGTRRRVWAVVVGMTAVILAGTVVTATGPHAGDEKARRFGFFAISEATRLHGSIVWITVALAGALLWHLRNRTRDREPLDGPLTLWFCVALLQGAIGYWQYATGVPAWMVAVHIAGATALWSITVWTLLCTSDAVPEPASVAPAADDQLDVAQL